MAEAYCQRCGHPWSFHTEFDSEMQCDAPGCPIDSCGPAPRPGAGSTTMATSPGEPMFPWDYDDPAEMPGTTADMTPSLLTEVMCEHMRRMAIERARWVINQPLMTEQLARIVHG